MGPLPLTVGDSGALLDLHMLLHPTPGAVKGNTTKKKLKKLVSRKDRTLSLSVGYSSPLN